MLKMPIYLESDPAMEKLTRTIIDRKFASFCISQRLEIAYARQFVLRAKALSTWSTCIY